MGGMLKAVIDTVIGNLQLSISNVHIRQAVPLNSYSATGDLKSYRDLRPYGSGIHRGTGGQVFHAVKAASVLRWCMHRSVHEQLSQVPQAASSFVGCTAQLAQFTFQRCCGVAWVT